jgi:uncharacterized phage infection (PIP) family protein YhgE
MKTFKTQKEIWQHLIENEGKPCLRGVRCFDTLIGLKDGQLWDFSTNTKSFNGFDNPADWQEYLEPEKSWLEKKASKEFNEEYVDVYRLGGKELAHEAIKRIRDSYSKANLSEDEIAAINSIKILRELIGEASLKQKEGG